MSFLDPKARATVLVVDDTPDNLSLMAGLLKDHYRIKLANSGDKALRVVQSEEPPDLILLDIMMPGMNGYEVMAALQADTRSAQIPVIFLTAMAASENEQQGLEMGAVDYITKPINPSICLARVRNHLRLKAAHDYHRDQSALLEKEVAKRTAEVVALQDVTISMMGSLAETRDNETGNHIRRTQRYVLALAKHLKDHARFRDYLTEHQINLLFKSAPLHDIGKVGIPDRILLKPGRFEPAEFEIMKTHCRIGRDAIEHAEHQLGFSADFLVCAKEIAYSHQEKWDGSGYPEGLSGDAIPTSARLMAVADVYDALISRRVYKEGMSHEKARAIILEGSGQHFDPDVVAAFVALEEQFRAIARQFADTDADMAAKAEQLEAIAIQPGSV